MLCVPSSSMFVYTSGAFESVRHQSGHYFYPNLRIWCLQSQISFGSIGLSNSSENSKFTNVQTCPETCNILSNFFYNDSNMFCQFLGFSKLIYFDWFSSLRSFTNF